MATERAKSATTDAKTVQELRQMAEGAVRAATQPAKRPALSRAARLSLIDQLSRWGGSGLALFASASIYIAVVAARGAPLRAVVWVSLVFAALYLCRRYRKEFRRGDRIASRPFRWRAYYTSTLAVVSAAFGAGAIILLPAETNQDAATQIIALMLIAVCGAAAFHAAHRPAAAAAGAPAFLAIIGAAAGVTGFAIFTPIFVAAAGGGLVAIAAWQAEKRAALRFPRTAFVRREIERGPVIAPAAQPARNAAAF